MLGKGGGRGHENVIRGWSREMGKGGVRLMHITISF